MRLIGNWFQHSLETIQRRFCQVLGDSLVGVPDNKAWSRCSWAPTSSSWKYKLGTGSSPVCNSPVLSRFNMDECHMETKQSKGQKNKPRNSLLFRLSLSITSPLFSLYLSFETDQTWASDYQRHQNKKNRGCECCAWGFIILGKSGQIGFLPVEG